MHFVTYTFVRQQMQDEGVRSALSQQHRRGWETLLCSELCARQILEVARAADAQATMLRRNSNHRARLLLPEAENCVKILPEEGQESCRVTRAAGWAKRQREMHIWNTRCRVALLQVYWERVEELGRWAVGTMEWRLNKVLLRQQQWNWERGWQHFRVQEEAAKLWAREGIQALGIACWHVRVLEQQPRPVLHTQAQQKWGRPLLRAGRWAAFLGRNELGGGGYRKRAMLVLLMEAAAARRR